MRQMREVVNGVWLSEGDGGQAAGGVALGAEGALVIDPGESEAEIEVVAAFLRDMGRSALALIYTGVSGGAGAALARWPAAAVIAPQSPAEAQQGEVAPPLVPLPVPGWEALLLEGAGRLVAHGGRERVVFTGGMLTGRDVPDVSEGSRLYLAGLARIEALDARLVVPFEGSPAQGKRAVRQRIERDRNYVYSLLRHAAMVRAAGYGLERALQAARASYESYPFLEAHLENVRRTWTDPLPE